MPRRPSPHALLASLLALAMLAIGCLVSAHAPARPEFAPPMLDEPSAFASIAANAQVDAPTQIQAPATIEQLQAAIAKVLEREQVPGVGLALIEDHQLRWAGGVGVADLASGRPVTADTLFRVGSISKTVIALGVLRLSEHGKLDLDAPLATTMPEIELGNAWHDRAPITLAHALEHTAGFDDMRFSEYWTPGDQLLSPREALAVNPRSRVARWRPGSRMSYSNPGYTIAAHAIEQASGEPWTTYLAREVLDPLAMPTATFVRTEALTQRLATGYSAPGRAEPFRNLVHAPAGALLASPRELASLVIVGLERGWPLVRPDAFARIETTATLPYPTTDANYGLGNYGDVMHRVAGRGHDGGLPGFLSSYQYFPALDGGYVMLLNATWSARAYVDIRALLFAYLTRGRTLPEPPIAPPDPDAIAAASGYYGFANPRMQLLGFIDRTLLGFDVYPAADGIELAPLLGGRIALLPTGDGGYRHASQAGTSVRLTTNAEGERIMLAGMGYFEASSGAWARAKLWALAAALALMQAAVVWGLAALAVALIRSMLGRPLARGVLAIHLWPALASASFFALVIAVEVMAARMAFVDANALSIAVCAASLLFPACSSVALVVSLRAGVRGEPAIWLRLIPSAASLAAFGISVVLLVNGFVGLRVWAW